MSKEEKKEARITYVGPDPEVFWGAALGAGLFAVFGFLAFGATGGIIGGMLGGGFGAALGVVAAERRKEREKALKSVA